MEWETVVHQTIPRGYHVSTSYMYTLMSNLNEKTCCFDVTGALAGLLLPGGRDSLTFGKGVLMSMKFLRLLNNQTNFFKDSK